MAPSRRAGLTLIEVMVSAVILSIMALAMLMASTTLTTTTNVAMVAMDLDRNADRFMAELRRELRQSGYQKLGSVANPMFWVDNATAPGVAAVTTGAGIRFRKRTVSDPLAAPFGAAWEPDCDERDPMVTTASPPPCHADNATWLEYIAISDGVFGDGTARLKVIRRQVDANTGAASGYGTLGGSEITGTRVEMLMDVQDFRVNVIVNDGGATNTLAYAHVQLRVARIDPQIRTKPTLTVRDYVEQMRMNNGQ